MRNKRLITLLGSICLVFVLAALPFLAACPAPPAEEEVLPPAEEEEKPTPVTPKPIELIYATYVPEGHAASVSFKWFSERVMERTEGRVKFRYNWTESFGSVRELLSLTEKGTCDISMFYSGYYPDEFRLVALGSLPYTGDDMWAKNWAFMELLKEEPTVNEEFRRHNIFVLAPLSAAELCLETRDRAVEKVEDLKGLKLRVSGGSLTEMARAWGVVPLVIATAETYDSLARGIIDGQCSAPIDSYVALGTQEICKYYIDVGAGCSTVLTTVMNLDSYNKLPPDIQKIFDEESIALIGKSVEIRMDLTRGAIKKVLEHGGEIYSLSPEVKAKLRDLGAGAAYELSIKEAEKIVLGEEARRIIRRLSELHEKYKAGSPYKSFVEIYETEFK